MWNLSPEYRFPMVAFPWFPMVSHWETPPIIQGAPEDERLAQALQALLHVTAGSYDLRTDVGSDLEDPGPGISQGYTANTICNIYILCVCACICMCICMYTIIYICRSLFSIISTVIIIYVYNVHIYIYIHILCTQCGTCLYCTNIF